MSFLSLFLLSLFHCLTQLHRYYTHSSTDLGSPRATPLIAFCVKASLFLSLLVHLPFLLVKFCDLHTEKHSKTRLGGSMGGTDGGKGEGHSMQSN